MTTQPHFAIRHYMQAWREQSKSLARGTGTTTKRTIKILMTWKRTQLGGVPAALAALTFVVAASGFPVAGAQTQGSPHTSSVARPAFEVASIKPSDPNQPRTMKFGPDTLTILNVPLATTVAQAYSLPPWQLSFGSFFSLMTEQRYDIVAKAAAPVPPDQMRLMLQRLLAERFHLEVHMEAKVVDVYALVVNQGGAELQPATPEEASDIAKELSTDGRVRTVKFTNATMPTLTSIVTEEAARAKGVQPPTVVDKTGLKGGFDFTLIWTRDLEPADSSVQPDMLSPVIGALHKVGLTLKKDKAPIDNLVVDHVDKAPTAN